jgi:hypothetical protein
MEDYVTGGKYKKVETLRKECYMRELSCFQFRLMDNQFVSMGNEFYSERHLLPDISNNFHKSLPFGYIWVY